MLMHLRLLQQRYLLG